jgi:DNA-binding MarR family transcriptional regulator
MEKPKLTILEQTALPRILVFLKNHKKGSRTELKNNIQASQQAIYNALHLLEREELIEEATPEGSPRRKDVFLTQKGQRIAEALEKLEGML